MKYYFTKLNDGALGTPLTNNTAKITSFSTFISTQKMKRIEKNKIAFECF